MADISTREHKEFLFRLKGRVDDLELIIAGIKNMLQASTDFMDQSDDVTPSDE